MLVSCPIVCKGTNNFVKACYPPLNNVKKKKIVSDEKISTMNFGLLTQKQF